MKRIACPLCGKPLLVPDGQPGKTLPCPTCRGQLVLTASGLAVADEFSHRPAAAAAVRPKPAMVPVIAAARAPQSAQPELPQPVAFPSLPPPNEKSQRPLWFVPVVAGSCFLCAIAALVAVSHALPFGSKPKAEEAVGPMVVNPLGRKNDKERERPVVRDRPAIGQAQPRAEAGARSGKRGASSASPKPFPDLTPVRPVASPASHDVSDPIQAVLRSVAVVTVPGEGHGSGFVASPGVLVTNYHVIEDAVIGDLQISFPDNDALAGRPLRAELIHLSITDDLAFLSIDADVRPLGVKTQYEHVNGQRVVAIGSPGSGGDGPTLENLTTDGRLGPELTLDDDEKRWALSMAVNGGNSGGPLVDAPSGEVIGVIVAKFTKTEAQSLAIPHSALVRELAKAGQASQDARAAVLSLHRQRYCVRRMARILGVTSFAFDRSIAAATANSDEGAVGMDAAFNECKTLAAAVFAKQFADFSGTVGGEVEDLQDDPNCDPRVRRGLSKLLSDIEDQADEIRRRVPSDEIVDFLGRFRGSVEGSRALVKSLAERLQMKPPENQQEQE